MSRAGDDAERSDRRSGAHEHRTEKVRNLNYDRDKRVAT